MSYPDRIREITEFRKAAREHRAIGEYRLARSFFNRWIESLRQQNINTGGKLQGEHEEAKLEFSEFVKTDPTYHNIRSAAIEKIREQPGILQTEMYKALYQFDKSDIQYALYFADDHGAIVRTKKGTTYSLTLPK